MSPAAGAATERTAPAGIVGVAAVVGAAESATARAMACSTGQPGAAETDTVTASGVDGAGTPVDASDSATITITDTPSSITLTKTANRTVLPWPGGEVIFTVEVQNTSAVDAVRIDTLTDSIYGNITQVGFIPDFSWSHLGLYVAMMGGYWYSDDGTRITFTSDSVVNALKWEQQFYCDYNTEDVLRFTSAFGGYMSPDNGFYAGKVAMMVEGEWQPGVNFIQKYKPELYYGVAPFPPPQANPERKNTNLVSGTVAMIPSGVKDKAAAWKLMAWMMSPEIVAEETEVSEAIHAAAHPGKVRAAGEGGSEAARTEEAAE